MKQDDANLNGLLSFGRNFEYLRSKLFRLTYSQLSVATHVPESTLVFYSRGVSPTLSVACSLAEIYSTSVDRLCSYPYSADIEEEIGLQQEFIIGYESVETDSWFPKVVNHILSSARIEDDEISVYDTLVILRNTLSDTIKDLVAKCPLEYLESDAPIGSFTDNLKYFLQISGIPYRQIGGACDIAIGNLTRLLSGADPKLSVAIKIADFFGVTMSQLMHFDLDFNLVPLVLDSQWKTTIDNNVPAVPQSVALRQAYLKEKMCGKKEAQKLIETIVGGLIA
ncbi:MAG: helix-turn-helix transcriptional regulator [Clostridia bacterium]|nr:helix-turn-helix transcriptional regulator [Clostridia bacterium]